MMLRLGSDRVRAIAEAVRAAGGRALLVGGVVRDAARAGSVTPESRDFDLEVYGVPADRLRALLDAFGPVHAVGESFAVYKVGEIDVSLPRRDSKTGSGHRGFTVTGDPSMTVEEAARRRDFRVNALLCDPLSGEVLDPVGGLADLKAGVLRAVDPTTFGEDSLRVLRGMQFAARFGFTIHPDTVALCRTIPLDDLPAERIRGEFEKLLLSGRPSAGLAAALDLGVVDKLFPELKALVGCPQEPRWHPEGDVWVHTLQAVDVAAGLIGDLPRPRQLAVMLATLCHDVGKPPTTRTIDGRIRSLEHEEAGVAPTTRLLDTLDVNAMDGYDVRRQVAALVANHLKPGHFHRDRDRVRDSAFRRLALKCELDLLYRVAKADSLGRRAGGAPEPTAEAQEWFRERAASLDVVHEPLKPILMGRHLLELGLKPGPKLGEILDAVYQQQLEGSIATQEDALAAARRLIG